MTDSELKESKLSLTNSCLDSITFIRGYLKGYIANTTELDRPAIAARVDPLLMELYRLVDSIDSITDIASIYSAKRFIAMKTSECTATINGNKS